MARYTVTVHFDDSHNEGPEAAALHASLLVTEAGARGFVVDSAEFIDHDAPAPQWMGSVDWLEYCQRDEAQREDA